VQNGKILAKMQNFNILLKRTKEAIKILITLQNVAHTMSTTITWELKIRNKDFIEFKFFFRIRTWDFILWHNKFILRRNSRFSLVHTEEDIILTFTFCSGCKCWCTLQWLDYKIQKIFTKLAWCNSTWTRRAWTWNQRFTSTICGNVCLNSCMHAVTTLTGLLALTIQRLTNKNQCLWN
jgi:hypothetical protein